MVELQLLRGIDRTRRATENCTLGLFAGESLLGALTDEIALDFGGKAECESQDLTGNVVAKPVVVLDCPDTAAASHAYVQNLHDHEQVAAKSGKFGTNNEITAPSYAEVRRIIVPLIVSSIQPSMVMLCFPQNLRISKR